MQSQALVPLSTTETPGQLTQLNSFQLINSSIPSGTFELAVGLTAVSAVVLTLIAYKLRIFKRCKLHFGKLCCQRKSRTIGTNTDYKWLDNKSTNTKDYSVSSKEANTQSEFTVKTNGPIIWAPARQAGEPLNNFLKRKFISELPQPLESHKLYLVTRSEGVQRNKIHIDRNCRQFKQATHQVHDYEVCQTCTQGLYRAQVVNNYLQHCRGGAELV